MTPASWPPCRATSVSCSCGACPFFSSKYDLKQHPNYKYTAEADKKKNAFDLESSSTAAGLG